MTLEKRRLKGLYWDKAWSLVEGCTRVDAACDNCWASTVVSRFGNADSKLFLSAEGSWNGRVLFRSDRLDIPLRFRNQSFTFSVWNDLFHEGIEPRSIYAALLRASSCVLHTFLFCTKRPEKILSPFGSLLRAVNLPFPSFSHMWFGTTLQDTSAGAMRRLSALCSAPVPHRFLSVEPMLGQVSLPDFCSDKIDLVIIGCESGSSKRDPEEVWLYRLLSQCDRMKIKVFVKQWVKGKKVVKLPFGPDSEYSQLPF
ncbi:MAG: DUF5131 family protein [Planctomycetes bacterium]|nr:DUF5131 family protein [Planctomycetota bacterium]